MGRTRHEYYRSLPYNHKGMLRTRRNQLPLLKRNSHHRFRARNRLADELTLQTFNSNHQYRLHYNQGYHTGHLRSIKYDYCYKDILPLLIQIKDDEQQVARLAMQIQKKFTLYSVFAHKKLQMWKSDIQKKLARRGSLKPFKGHRQPGILYKRELCY